MRIAITGSTGMIGSKITSFLLAQGHEVTQITRRSSVNDLQTPVIVWDPALGYIDPDKLEGFDVIIHLAGANVGERWDGIYKQSILDSRVQGTRLLCQALAKLNHKPKVLLSASAVGFYGNHEPQQVLDETSPNAQGFLPGVCYRWEQETQPAKDAGIRVVHMRFGVVLSKDGGALAKMWLPFQLGVGGILGNGRQMMSWVALSEIPFVIDHLIQNNISGPVNVVSSQPVSNAEFTKILGQIIKRPVICPVPAFAVRLLFGEMGQTLLLEGAHVVPSVLQRTGYKFHYPDIKSALEEAIR